MSKFLDMTIGDAARYAQAIEAEWNGDESGEQEDRANTAHELFSAIAAANALYEQLEGKAL